MKVIIEYEGKRYESAVESVNAEAVANDLYEHIGQLASFKMELEGGRY